MGFVAKDKKITKIESGGDFNKNLIKTSALVFIFIYLSLEVFPSIKETFFFFLVILKIFVFTLYVGNPLNG